MAGEELYYSCPFVGEQTDQEIGRLYVAVKETKMFSALAVPDQTSLRVSLTDRDNNYVSGNADEGKEWELISQEVIANSGWTMTARINKHILARVSGRCFI